MNTFNLFLKRFVKRQLTLASGIVYSLYKLWVLIYGQPDETAIIVFNELPRQCKFSHKDFKCPKKHCHVCRSLRIIEYIDKAKISMDIAMYTISCEIFFKAIARAIKRGVIIRFLTDSQMVYINGSKVKQLMDMGVALRCSPIHLIMHHKFCIIDGEERILQLDAEAERIPFHLWQRTGYLMTGSLNWTFTGSAVNYENVLVSSNRELQSLYQPLFENMWETFPHLGKASFRIETFGEAVDDNICLPWRFWEEHVRQKTSYELQT